VELLPTNKAANAVSEVGRAPCFGSAVVVTFGARSLRPALPCFDSRKAVVIQILVGGYPLVVPEAVLTIEDCCRKYISPFRSPERAPAMALAQTGLQSLITVLAIPLFCGSRWQMQLVKL
jgi:hypothetical protein